MEQGSSGTLFQIHCFQTDSTEFSIIHFNVVDQMSVGLFAHQSQIVDPDFEY